MSEDVQVQQLPVPCMLLGEGPHWLAGPQALLYADVFDKAVRRHNLSTGRHQVLYVDDGGASETISMVVPVQGRPDLLVLGLGNALALVSFPDDPQHDQPRTVKPLVVLHTTDDDHFNDAKCDPQGRLWAGTMTPIDKAGNILEYNTSSLFKYDLDLTCTKQVKNVTISNGLAWSPDRKSFYYVDSPAKNIYHFDYKDAAGTISNQRVLLNFESAGLMDQVPDGMTIDVDGRLWVACFGGGQVVCVDPSTGKVVRRVPVPSPSVTSTCWGGPDYSTLFVTSGKLKLTPEELVKHPAAGGTFAITGLGTKGFPPVNYKINLDKLQAMLAQTAEKSASQSATLFASAAPYMAPRTDTAADR